MTEKERKILAILAGVGSARGMELVHAVSRMDNVNTSLVLTAMRQNGLLDYRIIPHEGRAYFITEKGRRAL